MATVKRFNKLLGLENIDVLIDERDTSRHIIITDMPQSLPQGKSSFLIEVSPYMKEGVELQVDFMDSEGNSIYLEPVQNYLEGSSRTMSVEIYDTTAAGVATMILVGELDRIPTTPGNFSETEEVPVDFQGVYNVRLTREVIINTAELNTQPIKFYSSPRLIANEQRFGTMEREVVEGEVASAAFTVIGRPVTQQSYEVFTTEENESNAQGSGVTETNDNKSIKPPDGDVKGDKAEKEKLKQHTKKRSVRTDSRFKRSRRIRRRRSPVEYPYSFSISDEEHEFTTNEIGGEIRFSDIDTTIYNSEDLTNNGLETPTFNVVSDTLDENFPTHYTASIADLNNSLTAYTNTPFTKQDREGNYRILELKATGQTFYEKQPSASFSLTNIVSYADITLSHLRTFSGELFKAKVYVRSEGSFDDYKLLAEVPIESPELMINSNSVGIGERTGYFISEEDKNTYWDLFGSTNGLTAASSTSTASFDNNTLLDSIMVSGSTSTFSDQIRFQLKEDYKFVLTKDIDYTLSFNTVGQKDTDGRALMLVYISGSCMNQANSLYNDEFTEINIEESSAYGKRMGVLEVETSDDDRKDFNLVSHNFNTDSTGEATIQFRVISGQWNLSDISVIPATDTGFSPSFVKFQQQLPPELTHKRPETLEFLTEFYDMNNNLADEIAVTTGSIFTGANMVITGDDNTMSGDLFIGGDTTGSGMHFGGVDSNLPETGTDGATGSGFMRSVGYLGFASASDASLDGKPGFMIYSGSVLPDSGENYAGVGLELVGASGSLKFRTNPSLFDVQADAFFVGKTTTQFISGSGEKIEISSSNFHLDDAGNVDMTGTITANAGEVGGFTIKDSSLRAGTGNSSVTMSGADQLMKFGSGSTFTASEIDGILFGKDTDGKYKFGVGKGGSYVFFDGDAVQIASEDINVTASVFSIDVDEFKLSATNLFVSSSEGGFVSLGNPRPSGIGGTNNGIFMQGRNPDDTKPKFLAGNAAGGHISFDGDNVFMSSSAFFLGSPSQFVSGSLGNVEISSSNFHLDNAGNVIMSGKITANEGAIGGFNITDDALSSTNFFISGSPTAGGDDTPEHMFISASNFNVKASGDVTASALSLTGGDVGGLSVESGVISVGSILKLKDSGQITGSKVLFSGGTIGGFTVNGGAGQSSLIGKTSDPAERFRLDLLSGELQVEGNDGFGITLGGDASSGYEATTDTSIPIVLATTEDASRTVVRFGDSGQFFKFDSGATPKLTISSSDYFLGTSTTFISGSNGNIKVSGSNLELETPKFFLGRKGNQFVSGSNGNVEISSSDFHLTAQGDVTASAILLGDKDGSNFLQFAGDTLTVRGDLAVDSLFLPSTIDGATSTAVNASSSLDSNGFAKFVSASIGGFIVNSSQINSVNNNIVLQSNGAATISGSSVNLQAPIFYLGNQTNFISGSNGNIEIFNSGATTISGSSVNVQTPKFYLGETDNFISGSNGNIEIFNTGTTTISGSAVNIQTPKFYLGETGQFISGSNGNIEISSSNFHLDSAGNVVMSGKVTADTGEIGGFTIGDDLDSTAGTLKLKGASGQITASAAQITGKITAQTGTIGGFNIGTDLDSSAGTLKLKGATGQITASAAQITGKITATSGQIADFTIDGTKLKQGTAFHLDGASSAEYFISSSDFQVTPAGQLTGSSALFDGTIDVTGTGTIAGWTIASGRFNDSGDNLRLDGDESQISVKNHTFGQAGIQLQYNSGTTRMYVGDGANKHLKFDGSDVDIKSAKFELDATNLELSSTHASMSLGEGKIRLVGASTSTITVGAANAIKLSDDGSDRFLVVGSKTSFAHFDQSTAGLILGTDNGTTKFELAADANNYISFDGSEFDIKTAEFTLDTTNLDINSSTKRIEVSDGSNVRVRIGEVDSTSANHFGITIYDGTGTAASDEIVHLSDAKNQIASWSLSPNQISSNNLILDSDGTIQTADFASNVKGWRITSANNGEAEFENVRIRGTLSTAVFEKETVNAVGGQLYVANSTAITGSDTLAATATTMSVVNVTGFAENEVLSAKKVTSTGFGTEYMLVQSSSRDNPSSESDFAGKLFLIRGYRSGSNGISGSLGDIANASQSYEPGQVIVSTGKVGTGYIRLNANPNDSTTPYMDIVERTGSGVYDVDLKARLGDLSGLSSGLLYGESNPGFGLFTENVFLSGAITATTGSITGILHVRTDLLNQVTIGTNVKNSLDGIHINDNNFWYTNGHFRTGFDSDNFIHQSGSALTLKSETFTLKGGTTLILDSTTPKLVMGSSAASITDTDNTGIYMDGSGKFRVGEDQGSGDNFIYFNGTTIQMKSTVFDLVAGSTLVINSSTPKIALGASATGQSLTSGTGIFMNGSGHFKAGKAGHGRIEWDGTDVYVSSSAFFLGSDSQFLSGSNGNLEISSSKFHLQPDGDTIMQGKITATSGEIAGLSIESDKIYVGTGNHNNSDTSFYVENDGKFSLKDKLSWDGSDLSIEGSITITGGSGFASPAAVSGSVSDLSGSVATDVGGLAVASSSMASTARLTSTGMEILNSDDNVIAAYSADAVIGRTDAGQSNVLIDSDGSIDIRRGTEVSASFGTTTTIGPTSGNHVEITSTSLAIKTSSNVTALSASAAGLDMAGTIKASGGTIGGFDIGTDLESQSGTLNLKGSTGQITGSAVLFDGGKIGGFTIDADEIKSGTNIGLDSTNKKLTINDTTFGNEGIQLEYNGGTPRLYVGDGSNEFFKYDGTNIDIRTQKLNASGSSIILKSSDFYLGDSSNFVSGSGGNLSIFSTGDTTLSGSSITLSTPKFFMGEVSQFISGSNGNIEISSSNFHLQPDGNVIMSGTVTAGAGEIGGFTLSDTEISASGLVLKASGQMTASAVSMSGMINASSGQIGNFAIDSNNLVGGGTFQLNPTNNSGEVRMGSSFGPNSADSTTTGIYLSGTGEFGFIQDTNNRVFSDGNGLDIRSTEFVLNAGTLELENKTTTTGKLRLGGTLPTAYDSGVGFYADGTGKFLVGNSTGSRIQYDGNNTLILSSSKFVIGDIGSNFVSGSDGNLEISSSKFHLDSKNEIFSVGQPSGSRIQFDGTELIMSSSKFLLGGGEQFVSGSNGNIEISSSNFHLQPDGDVVMSGTVTANAGAIGGFTINSGAIESSNIKISSTHASMSLGGNVKIVGGTDSFIAGGSSHLDDPFGAAFDNDNTGFVLGIDDDVVKFEISDDSGDNKIVFDSSASDVLVLKAESFSFGSTNFKLTDSSLKLGTIDNVTDTASTETGFFVDSSGNVLIKTGTSSETGYMQFNSNNLKIKTSNFEVDGGDVTITGAVTATSGNIATFSITSGSIDSNSNNAKRGIKVEPGASIRGYGNEVHKTTTVAGKFSFSVGSVSPSATANVPFNSNYSAPPGLSGD